MGDYGWLRVWVYNRFDCSWVSFSHLNLEIENISLKRQHHPPSHSGRAVPIRRVQLQAGSACLQCRGWLSLQVPLGRIRREERAEGSGWGPSRRDAKPEAQSGMMCEMTNRLGYIYHCTTPFCHSCFKTQSPAPLARTCSFPSFSNRDRKALSILWLDLLRRALSAGVRHGVSTAMGCFAVPLLEWVTAGDATDHEGVGAALRA